MSASRPRKRGGSQARRRSRAERRDPMLGHLSRNLPIVEPLDQQQIERIDHESMRILEEVGVVFRDPIALEDWRKAGVRVDGERVYFDRGHIRELISSIPATISNSGSRKVSSCWTPSASAKAVPDAIPVS
jgi:trimethylamine--corrinoid protein Co-methyltransferase